MCFSLPSVRILIIFQRERIEAWKNAKDVIIDPNYNQKSTFVRENFEVVGKSKSCSISTSAISKIKHQLCILLGYHSQYNLDIEKTKKYSGN